ncbi:hypothetical protein MTO96_012856 [Rhipicephalus appendiculatus]
MMVPLEAPVRVPNPLYALGAGVSEEYPYSLSRPARPAPRAKTAEQPEPSQTSLIQRWPRSPKLSVSACNGRIALSVCVRLAQPCSERVSYRRGP